MLVLACDGVISETHLSQGSFAIQVYASGSDVVSLRLLGNRRVYAGLRAADCAMHGRWLKAILQRRLVCIIREAHHR